MKLDTACIHGVKDRTHGTGAVCAPIYQTSTFAHPGVAQSTGYDYTRQQNPTREHLERIMAQLEGGAGALAFSSGMAAIATLMELFSPGDQILASDDLYGGTIRLFDRISSKNGLDIRYVDTCDLSAVQAALTPLTKAVYVETPSNPMMRVTDIAAVKSLIGGRDILLITDNTFLTPYYCRPIELGADIVTHSGTKYLGGHNDTMAGFLVPADDALTERLRFLHKTTGACLSPFDSFLLIRGIKTLALRMERAQQNAQRLAHWLLAQNKVTAVHYVGLETHPSIQISRKQASGFGSMISFAVDSPETACHILENVKLILYAESLGGVESLITYPLLQTHADVPEEQRLERGITDRLLRLSVGIEHIDDLIGDLAQAME
ncbi:MAG: PLP-dependent aspartate aminotransferase family protein [Clostridiales Family XIII bacterium]|jgi:cystathionine beta-lyase/cystathionine gamma-synthase|nr:PLP-dependent aspartate aminotransferase family protein [Clostridiales Family XIII bacterium]